MKTYLLFASLVLWISGQTKAQPCRQIAIADTAQRKALANYIDKSNRYFVNDRGVVVVTRFVNEAGRPSWSVRIIINDEYKDNPPVEWTSLGEAIILFYDTGSSHLMSSSTSQRLNCCTAWMKHLATGCTYAHPDETAGLRCPERMGNPTR